MAFRSGLLCADFCKHLEAAGQGLSGNDGQRGADRVLHRQPHQQHERGQHQAPPPPAPSNAVREPVAMPANGTHAAWIAGLETQQRRRTMASPAAPAKSANASIRM